MKKHASIGENAATNKKKPRAAFREKIEKALFIANVGQLRPWEIGFSRVYFGAELCERLLPSEKDLRAAKKFCKKNKMGFSLVTPFLTDPGIEKALRLVRLLSPHDELVVNDYGLLPALKRKKPGLVAGRLLNRQYRDPRIPGFKGKVPKDFFTHLTQSHAAADGFRQLLQRNGFERVELDNLPQGIGTDLSGSRLRGSLYAPFTFVATTRLCLSANCDNISFYNKMGIFPCGRECQRYQFTLSSPGMGTLFLFGNTVFAKNQRLPSEEQLLRRGINRIVVNSPLQLFQK
ncbi:MAG: hypothetical protein NTW59_03570 [Candidatus Diapherotrites archaeon]|nr:hypothetical protein [Candidatus Diapherotrites archaeon]